MAKEKQPQPLPKMDRAERNVRRTARLIRVLAILTFVISLGGALLRAWGFWGEPVADTDTYLWEATINLIPVVICFSLTFIPQILNNYKIYLPPSFQISILVFVFLANFLGDFFGFYYLFPWWDKALHTLSGIILGLIGFLLVYMMNQSPDNEVQLSPKFVALFTLTFALASGVIWEITEFLIDTYLGTNMQRWEGMPGFPLLGFPEQGNGLLDTMNDLVVDLIGGTVASVAGYIYLRERERFIKEGANNPIKGISLIYQDILDYVHQKMR